MKKFISILLLFAMVFAASCSRTLVISEETVTAEETRSQVSQSEGSDKGSGSENNNKKPKQKSKFEEYFYNDNPVEPTEPLTYDPVTSQGARNVIKRAKQFTELSWTPTNDSMPGMFRYRDSYTFNYFYYVQGKEYKGIPYSSVKENDSYVGSNCSIETYISAICNPNSVIYTKNLRNTYSKSCTYYGMVCSRFVCACLGITEVYNTAHMKDIPGLKTIAAKGKYTENDIKTCDILNKPSNHTVLVTGILRDSSGTIKYIEVSEETLASKMRCQKWSIKDFFEHFGDYDLHRYEYLDSVTYEKSNFVNIDGETAQLDDRKYDVLTRYGDKCNIRFSTQENNLVILDILTNDWTKAVVYNDKKVVAEFDVSGKKEFEFNPKNAGFYQIELTNGAKKSRSCYFCMYDANLTVNSADDSKFDISYSSSTGNACWVHLGSIGDSVYKKVNGSGHEVINYTEKLTERQIRIAFENEYGVYLTDYIK